MKYHFLSTAFVMLLSLTYYGVQHVLGQLIAIDKNTCEIQLLARSYFNHKEYVTLCAECKDQYVLSFDLQTCIHYQEIGESRIQYCKRLGRDGVTCIEALCTIQINELGEFISVQYGNNNENCAQFDSRTGDCIFPRLNFELDLDTQIITENTETFCALKKLVGGVKVCIEYHSIFIDTKLGYSVFPDQFYNSDKIDLINSTHLEIICISGYEIILNSTERTAESSAISIRKFIGCRFIVNFSIRNCMASHIIYRYCVQCQEGYSLNINGLECIQLNHCKRHKRVFGQYICLQCEDMYVLINGQCFPLNQCETQDSSSSCAFCLFPNYGYRCENINKTVPDECELLNRYGNCVRCKNNDIYFWHIFNQRCQLRKLSIHCIHKSYISDQCDSFKCEEGYYFNAIHYEVYYGVFHQYQAYSCEYLQSDAKQNYYWAWYDYNYYDYGQLMNSIRDVYYFKYHFNLGQYEEENFCIIRQKKITGCLVYDECFESCLKCESGLSLVQDDSSDFYYKFICVMKAQTNIVIRKIEFCIKYDMSNGNCLACEDYYTNYYTECKIGTIKNCRVYADQNICLVCEINYALFNNQCFYVEYCLEYQWIKINLYCTKCIQRPDTAISLVQTSNLFRSDCVVNLPLEYCAHFIDDVCVRCIRGYILIIGLNKCIYFQFIKGGLHCLKASQSLHCSECIPGYRLVTIDGVSSCVKVNGSCVIRKTCDVSRCTIDCQGLYINYQPTCKYQCPQGQGIYYGYCINCVDYYGEGCQSCNGFQYCDRCSDGYFWDHDARRCKYTCPNGLIVDSIYQCNNCRVPNCANCSSPDVCIGCLGKLFLENNRCVEQCSENYHEFIGTPPQVNICYYCPAGCAACAIDTLMNLYCTKCLPDLFLDNGKCVDKCTFYQLGQNCTNICKNFVLDGQCVDKCPIYFVSKFNDEGIFVRICITICDTFIYEDNPQECANQYCRGGYYADSLLKLCQKCQLEHCQSCLNGIDQCGLCEKGYYLKDGICWYICEDSLRLVRDPYDCLRCYQRGCTNDCFYDGICTNCADNYLLENNICRCPTEKGYTLEYPGICRPPQPPDCLDPNCVICSPYSYCHQCLPGFYLIYLGINADGLEINSCVQVCPPGYYLQNGVCYPCSANCVSCISYELCRQCADGYVAVVKKMIPGRSIFSYRYEYMIQCLFRCRDGTLVYSPRQCRCHFACRECDNGVCKSCNEGFSLGIDNNCNGTTCDLRKCKLCDASNNQICAQCDDGYQPLEGKCRKICPNGTLSQTDDDICKREDFSCLVPYCAECPNDPAICTQCEGVLVLMGNACAVFCWWPIIYEELEYEKLQFCIPCPFQCATCDYQGNCLTCKGNNTLENNCMCPAGYVLSRDRCVKKCPYYSETINNQYCLKHCADGLSPYHTINRQQRQCQKVTDFTANFCIQNIENIPDIITISMDEIKEGADSFQIRIKLEDTPSECYTYILRGKNDQQVQIYEIEKDFDLLQLGATLPLPPGLLQILECTDVICLATIEIYFAETIQYIVHIEINFQLTLIITNGIQYQGSYATFNAVCPTCLIPAKAIIKSRVQIICPINNTCGNDRIQTITNSVITIIQIIDDPRFFNNKLQPHSLKLVYINSNGLEITLFITNYLYDNSKLGTISYTFKAIALRSGQLIVTSIVNNANFQNSQTRMLAESSTSETAFYPQFKIDLQMKEDEIADSSNQGNTIIIHEEVNNSIGIIIGAAVGGGILLIIIGIVIYKIYSKKQQKKNSYLRAQSTINKISESEIPHPVIAATSPHIQEQNIIQDKKLEIRIPSIAEHL